MTPARVLPESGPQCSLDVAANDGGTAPWHAPGGFATGELGHARPSADTSTTLAPPRVGVIGQTDRGAQTFARLVARWGDGSAYQGDLWLDILEYRALRMRGLGESALGPADATRLAALEQGLRAKDGSGARQFTRFSCRRSAALSFVAPRGGPSGPCDVIVVDLSAGGAKFELLRPIPLTEGAEVELHVEEAGGPISTVLPSRIVWVRGGTFGIMFAGAPRKAR
jgi:PilZ domain